MGCDSRLRTDGSMAMADELLCGVGGETACLGVAELREAIKTTLDKPARARPHHSACGCR